jgi:pimeloyl-ACP methyl ester carboxylesterase
VQHARRDEPPGRLVDVGGFRLHVHCSGRGGPTVVFDAALGGSSLSWCLVQPQVAALTRTCSYDRAGLGWSDAGPVPRTAGRSAAELRALLDRADVPAPYVLVGHSFGTLVMRIFAARYPGQVAGLVLVEPAFPEDLIEPSKVERRRIRRGVRLCRYGAVAARLRIAHLMSSGSGASGLARAAVRFVSRSRADGDRQEILAPLAKLPSDSRAVLTKMWTQPGFFRALGSHIESIAVSAQEVIDAGDSPAHVPLTVLSATNPPPHHVDLQERLARTSSRGRRIVASASGHWVPLEQPEAVAAAVLDVVAAVRTGRLPQPSTR